MYIYIYIFISFALELPPLHDFEVKVSAVLVPSCRRAVVPLSNPQGKKDEKMEKRALLEARIAESFNSIAQV